VNRHCVLLFLAVGPAYSQFSQLATTDDGSQAYFVTSLRLKGEGGAGLRTTPAIYRVVEGRAERVTEPPQYTTSHYNPQVSGDGQVVSYTQINTFTNPTTYASYVAVGARPFSEPISGIAQVSRNGRYVAISGRWTYYPNRKVEIHYLRDLQTGETTQMNVWPASNRALSSDGRVLGFDPQNANLVLWSRQDVQPLRTVEPVSSAVLPDAANWVVYLTPASPKNSLRALDLASGRDFLLASDVLPPSVSSDGSLVLYVAEPEPGQARQAFVIRTDGVGRRQVTSVPEGVSEAVLAGSGRAALAATKTGRLLNIDLDRGASQEIIAATPTYSVSGGLSLGAVLWVAGAGLASSSRVASTPLPRELDGVRVVVDGQALPLLSIAPNLIRFQVPFEMAVTNRPVAFEVPNSSVFEGGPRQAIISRRRPYMAITDGWLLLAREGFGSVVTRAQPARPGEIVHAYATGLGPVSPGAETGVPAPTGHAISLADAFQCRAGSFNFDTKPIDLLFAGLAPGMIGIYQISVRLPSPLPVNSGNYFILACGFPDNPNDWAAGGVPGVRTIAPSRSRRN
jgi:uncharacterized protein (TIGR03437 family)